MRMCAATTILLVLVTAVATVVAQDYTPSEENMEMREWFQDAKFGLFIHWGLYSIPGGFWNGKEVEGNSEWIMRVEDISVAEYEKLSRKFNPTEFDADAWCRMAKDAGMQYITITSKHHDGFAMYDSAVSEYDIVDKTPYGKDVLKALAKACKKHGLKLFFYYSQMDWHHPDYNAHGDTGRHSERPDRGNWNTYLDYMDAQLRELCMNYGTLGGIWFDGMWDKPDAEWRLDKTYGLIHQLQPQALIGSNHHVKPFPGEDFQMFEKGLPGEDPYSKEKHVSDRLPLEMCETINGSWGYDSGDQNHKSPEQIVHLLVQAAGLNANMLLNVGPKPDGSIQREHQERLAEVGQWIREYGHTVYGTRGGPIAPQSWGVTTQKGNTVFVHVLNDRSEEIALPRLDKRIVSATVAGGGPVQFTDTDLGPIIKLPVGQRRPIDTVVILETAP